MPKENRKEPSRDRILKLLPQAPEPDVSDDEMSDDDVIAPQVADASERDLAALLREFPRESDFVLAIYEQFLARGRDWSPSLKHQLADALARCRLPDEAQVVRDK
jgi:hypothetical protein